MTLYTKYHDIQNAFINEKNDDLVRVIYISKATLTNRVNSDRMLAQIESQSVTNNNKNGLSGVLCYGNGYFLQCIEGKKKNILETLKRIFADKRHHSIMVTQSKPIDKLSFEGWAMRSLLLEDWLWKDTYKEYVKKLALYIPFHPNEWSIQKTQDFLNVMNRTDIPIISNQRISVTPSGGMAAIINEYSILKVLMVTFVVLFILLIYFNLS